MFDYIIKNGTLIDGTGSPRYQADLAISGDQIVKIGQLDCAEAKEVLDASGCIVCPGFIDNHSHADQNVLADPYGRNFLCQGITTEVGGNCGDSLSPHHGEIISIAASSMTFADKETMADIKATTKTFPEFMDKLGKTPISANMSSYIGHGAIRNKVMGYSPEAPTPEQLEEMKRIVREAMEAGAAGMTSGLIYPPGSYAKIPELVELCKVVAEYGGNYGTPVRSEGDGVINSVKEAIEVARQSGVHLILSHHKVSGQKNWGDSAVTLGLVEEALKEGINVHLDQYPYNAGATVLSCTIPQEFSAQGMPALLKNLESPAFREEVKEVILHGTSSSEIVVRSTGGLQNIIVTMAPGMSEVEGKRVTEIAEEWGVAPYDALFDLLIRTNGKAMAVFFVMNEADVERIMQHPRVMFGTDASQSSFVNAFGHPRAFASFPRILSYYVGERGLLTLEEAIRKSTSLPAEVLGLKHKGILREGMDADIAVIDLENLSTEASYVNPNGCNHGFKYVLVNGQIAVKNDVCTDVMSGRLLRMNGDV